jgi:iron complex outermembrane receptor protein
MAATAAQDEDLVDLSLEELGDIQVTSVSRRAERLLDAPAAIYVIGADDIRRAGARTLPEALRLAPNLEVARVNAHAYAISARGFNNATGNKLQVLLDGRILYTPLFSGVFWDAHDVVLEDIERIEVVSGPGATLWGANAVNGVINVITRRASDTQGALASASTGTDGHDLALRVGAGGADGAWRIYGRHLRVDASERADGTDQLDGWQRTELGFRADWGAPGRGFTLQGAAFRGDVDTAQPDDLRSRGHHLLARWTHRLASGDTVQLQGYYDRRRRDIPASVRQRLTIHDLEFQHDVTGIARHALTWGLSHRVADDHVDNAPAIAFLPADRRLHWTSVFAQDTFALRDDLRLIAGVRVEDNAYTGTEVLPTLRLAWKPSESQVLWAAATRAVRTPSRLDRELFIPGEAPFQLAGGPGFRSEVARVLSLGYRAQPSARVAWAATLFHHDYDELRSIEAQPGGGFALGNRMEGRGTGLEAWATVHATQAWRLAAGGTWLDLDLRLEPGSTDPTGTATAANDPEFQLMLRSSLALPRGLELDAHLRHVGALPAPRVPAYTTLDLRLGWRPHARLDLWMAARNLLGDRHVEFGNPLTASGFGREWRLGATWAF